MVNTGERKALRPRWRASCSARSKAGAGALGGKRITDIDPDLGRRERRKEG